MDERRDSGMDGKRDDRQGMTGQQTVTVVTVDIDGDKDAMGDREWEAYDEFVSALRAADIRVAWYEYEDGTWDKNGKEVSGREGKG